LAVATAEPTEATLAPIGARVACAAGRTELFGAEHQRVGSAIQRTDDLWHRLDNIAFYDGRMEFLLEARDFCNASEFDPSFWSRLMGLSSLWFVIQSLGL